jgi:Protein of unknown function (DUF3592)
VGALLLVGLVFIIIGLAVLISGIVAAVKQKRKSARGVAATGTVINLVKKIFNPGSAGVYCPVVQFTTGTGEQVQFESGFGTMPASYRVGQTIAVRYDRANPHSAEVDSATANWFVPGCTIAMGFLFFAMGLVFMVIGILMLASQPQN